MTGSAAIDPFTVEADDEAQRAVGRRVLRTDVQHHVAGVELDVHLRVGEVPQRAGIDLDVGELARRRQIRVRGGHSGPRSFLARLARTDGGGPGRLTGHALDVHEARPRLHLACEQRKVLAQRMSFELRRQIEMTETRMTVEDDAEHLPRLTLVPIGALGTPETQDSARMSVSATSVLSSARQSL